MNSKLTYWFVLIISLLLILGNIFVLIKDVGFFITRRETLARIISIKKPFDYNIQLTYYNDYRKEDFNTTVKLKRSYQDKIEAFGETVSIYYSRLFPHDVYILNCKVPRKGIIALEFIMLLIFCVGFKSGFDGVRRQ